MWVLQCFGLNSCQKLVLFFRVLEGLLSNHHISYLHGGVVAALLHVQQRSALPASPELHLQPAGTGGLRGRPLQGPSQQDVAFGALLQGVVQAARAIQGQGGVHAHIYGGRRFSSFHFGFTGDCKIYVSTLVLVCMQD